MARITLDGAHFEVDPSLTIIEAAKSRGIDIPHFCYHPKLSVSGNCRMCLVEVEKTPKLVIACATQVADGMVVHTNNERVCSAREAVMEFLLINHPLDCPICDEAGECKLQEYAYRHSTGTSRFDEDKVHKPKRVELGPRVMLDVERCIMCSRCIRFTEEIVGKHQLTFTQRGDHVTLTTFPGESLDNPYSMNVIDLCPVGALTSRDFRFRSRTWEMSATASVCPGCARGCSIDIWVRDNEILRLTPRHNESVNSYWMCDRGRLTSFTHVNARNRIACPLVRKDGAQVPASWGEAIRNSARRLREFKPSQIAVLGSAYATNEDNYLLQKFARAVLSTDNLNFLSHVVVGDEDSFLIRADKTPNSHGARAVGVQRSAGGSRTVEIAAGIRSGTIKALYALEDDIAAAPEFVGVLPMLKLLIVHGTNTSATTELAHIVFPASTFAEKHGTFTNFDGHVQRICPAVATKEEDRQLGGFTLSRWDKFSSPFDKWAQGAKRDAHPSWRILTDLAAAMGTKWKFETVDDVFAEMASKVDFFHGLTFQRVGSLGVTRGVSSPASAAAASTARS